MPSLSFSSLSVSHLRSRPSAALAVGLAILLGVALAGDAVAEKKSKSVQTEAKWVSYDADASQVTVKVMKPGRGNKDKSLRKNKEASFKVKAEGSVLTRTTVAVNGLAGKITDIPAGKTVNVYWVPDEKEEGVRFARKIDVIFSDEELDARASEVTKE